MPTFFEYEPRDTSIHRLNPLAKLVLVLNLFITMSIVWDLRYLSLVTMVTLVIYILAKAPKKWLWLAAPFGAFRFIEAGILGVAQVPASFAMDPALASEALFSIGPLTFTFAGFSWALAYIMRIFTMMAATFLFIYTTPINRLINSFRSLRVPEKLTYVVTVAFRFVPELLRQIQLSQRAQSLRGVDLSTKNPVTLVKRAKAIVAPFVTRIIGFVQTMSLTTQIRGFGGGRGGARARLQFRISDWIVVVLSTFMTFLVGYALFVLKIGIV